MATTNGSDAFDKLAAAMPKIAAALKALPDTVHARAFEELLAAAKGEAAPASGTSTVTQTEKKPNRRTGMTRKTTTTDGAKKRKRSSGDPSRDKDLDLTPKGKKSFKDFVAEKKPKTNHDKSVASVYYLTHEAGISPVTIDQVYTCYRDEGWPLPSDFANSLAATASQKRYLNTADLQNIALTSAGINRVEHELPPPAKG